MTSKNRIVIISLMGESSISSPDVAGEKTSEQIFTDNITASLAKVIDERAKADPEFRQLANEGMAGLVRYLSNANRGTETEEAKGLLICLSIMSSKEELGTRRGNEQTAGRVALFVKRIGNRVGSENPDGNYVVKVANNSTARTTTVSLPK